MGVTARMTVAEIFRYVATSFSPEEAKAVQLYFAQGCGYNELARELALGEPKQAEQLIRRLNARLRYRFMGES
jgi:hypothetical protein